MLLPVLAMGLCLLRAIKENKRDGDTGGGAVPQCQSVCCSAPVSYTHLDVYKRQGQTETDYLKAKDSRLAAVIDRLGHINRTVDTLSLIHI